MQNVKCKIAVFPSEMVFNSVRKADTFIQHFAFPRQTAIIRFINNPP